MKHLNLLILLILLSLTGCSAPIPLTNDEMKSIENITVVNSFPEFPAYEVIGTTIFNNSFLKIEDHSYKAYITQIVLDYLKGKGYSVIVADSKPSESTTGIILEIIPMDLGYGFWEDSFLGKSFVSISYTYLYIEPKLNNELRCDSCWDGAAERTILKMDIPDYWEELSEDDKAILRNHLRATIKTATTKALEQTGL